MKAFLQEKLLKVMRYPPPSAMTIDNLYGYLDALYQCRFIEGPVVEVGCARGGTTVPACRFLSRINCKKDYYCIDTFGGFVPEQLETDHGLGLTTSHDRLFKDNSIQRFRSTLSALDLHTHIHLVQADICQVDATSIPSGISVALIDVDLRDPVFAGLEKIYPKLADGGVMLVDDCKEGTSWVGANVGYQEFMAKYELEPKYFMGFGVVDRSGDESRTRWDMSASPNTIAKNFFT